MSWGGPAPIVARLEVIETPDGLGVHGEIAEGLPPALLQKALIEYIASMDTSEGASDGDEPPGWGRA